MCIIIYIFDFKKNKEKNPQKTPNKQRRKTKQEKAKEEKKISVENLKGCDDIVCEFALCTFNLLCVTREITVFVILQQHMKYTFKNKTKKRQLRDIFVDHFLFFICFFVAATFL